MSNLLIYHGDLFFRLLFSVLMGIVIGLERAYKKKPAGIRTHAIVCLGSCLVMVLSLLSTGDPMRLAAQVVSGIGFIGAGVIWTDRKNMKHGLTTAANLWITSAVGLTIGYGAYDIAIFTGILMWLAMNSHDLVVKMGIIEGDTESNTDEE